MLASFERVLLRRDRLTRAELGLEPLYELGLFLRRPTHLLPLLTLLDHPSPGKYLIAHRKQNRALYVTGQGLGSAPCSLLYSRFLVWKATRASFEASPDLTSSSSSFLRRARSSLVSAFWNSLRAPSSSKPTSSPYLWALNTKSSAGFPCRASISTANEGSSAAATHNSRIASSARVSGNSGVSSSASMCSTMPRSVKRHASSVHSGERGGSQVRFAGAARLKRGRSRWPSRRSTSPSARRASCATSLVIWSLNTGAVIFSMWVFAIETSFARPSAVAKSPSVRS